MKPIRKKLEDTEESKNVPAPMIWKKNIQITCKMYLDQVTEFHGQRMNFETFG
jgi:hypothetical protein